MNGSRKPRNLITMHLCTDNRREFASSRLCSLEDPTLGQLRLARDLAEKYSHTSQSTGMTYANIWNSNLETGSHLFETNVMVGLYFLVFFVENHKIISEEMKLFGLEISDCFVLTFGSI